MDQKTLYSMIASTGAIVLFFEDHPGFFGNWRTIVVKRHKTLEVISDHREGWIQFREILQNQSSVELRSMDSGIFDESRELSEIQLWLETQ